MIDIYADGDVLVLAYSPDQGTHWIPGAFSTWQAVRLKGGVFAFRRQDFHGEAPTDEELEDGVDTLEFVLGLREGDYFRIEPDVVGTDHTFFTHVGMSLTTKHFVAERNISILRSIDALVEGDVYLGGDNDSAIPESVIDELIERFPNAYELRKYARARVSGCIREYLDQSVDAEAQYERYLSRRKASAPLSMPAGLRRSEQAKYRFLADRLHTMLANATSYDEHKWQVEILDLLLLLYPKYIRRFSAVPVRDVYAGKWRELDFMLVDANGNVDLVEIKKPFDDAIMSKRTYRDNHVPLRELSGAVMQVEKYLFYLSKWGPAGEAHLTKRYRAELPTGVDIQIVNPQGVVIMGREQGLTPAQLRDFEVVKRKYKNLVDIVTYDDLLRRLDVLIAATDN